MGRNRCASLSCPRKLTDKLPRFYRGLAGSNPAEGISLVSCVMNLKEQKKDFLLSVFFSNSVVAAFAQRGRGKKKRGVYRIGVSDEERTEMHEFLSDSLKDWWLDSLRMRGRKELSGEELTCYLSNLKNQADERFKAILNTENQSRITFGTVQKLVNLYLKYLWCANLIGFEPPHCPVDSIVLKELKREMKKGDISTKSIDEIIWTTMNQKQYNEVIKSIKATTNLNSTAQWELEVWEKDRFVRDILKSRREVNNVKVQP